MKKRTSVVPTPNFTSMVDVLFQLLIFIFVVTQVRTSSVDVDLPEVERAEKEEGDLAAKEPALSITVDAANRIWLDGEEVGEVKALRARLERRRTGEGAAKPVRVTTDRKAAGGTLVEVMGLLSESGFPKIEFDCVEAEKR